MVRQKYVLVTLIAVLLAALLAGSFSIARAETAASTAGVAVTFGDLVYSNQGRMAVVQVAVQNTGITPAISGGKYYFIRQQDGNRHDVTLLGVSHGTVPLALPWDPEYGVAPLWKAHVIFTDGVAADFYVGCQYLETVIASGFEPPDLHWKVNWPGGWFDCGNGYRVKPEDLAPGASASVPLTIYLQHPRLWADPPPNRQVSSLTLSVWRADGVLLENVASKTFP